MVAATCFLSLLVSVSCAGDEDPKAGAKDADERKEGKGSGVEAEPKKDESKLTIDEVYVRKRLAEAFHPTQIRFLDDGRVKLDFDFREKKTEHDKVFTPPVSADIQNPFRWTVRGEESFTYMNDGTSRLTRGGLRIAGKGVALINCWFLDDVEVELDYIHRVNFDPRQTVAVVFQTDSGKALGSNFGTQCASYAAGLLKGEPKGKPEMLMATRDSSEFKLVVKNGAFEAHLEKKLKQSMPYKRGEFSAGRVGFLWGPNNAGIVTKLEVTGRLDVKRMAKELRKGKPK